MNEIGMGPSNNLGKKDSIKQAQEFWSKRYRREVTENEVEEIQRNLTAYFSILAEWKRDEDSKQTINNENPPK